MRMTMKFRDSLKRNTKNTRLTSEIPAQYLIRLPIQTYARQFGWGSETCKTPGWEKRLMKSSPLQTERTWTQDALKTVYGPQSSGTTPLLSADRTSLLTDKEAILERWTEHFDGVLNRPSSINDEAINRLPQVECNPLLDELPTVSETVKAIQLLSSGKAPGSDAIPAEIYKAGGTPVAEKLTDYVEKRSYPSRIQGCNNYPPIQKERESSSVTIIEASLYCQLLGRVLLGSYWTDWMNTWNGQGFYQKANVDSGKTEEQ